MQELERQAMKYEFLMERNTLRYLKDPKNNQEAFKTAIRASKESHKLWKKIMFLEKLLKRPF